MEAARGEARNATRSATSRGFARTAKRNAAKRVHHNLAAAFVVGGVLSRETSLWLYANDSQPRTFRIGSLVKGLA
jgi:hypothetical protein